jgi:hypothetical protein
MKRSAGITITAVSTFIGSAIALLAAGLMGLTFTIAIPNGKLPHGFGYVAIFSVLVIVFTAGWGVASGVGLLNLREWSRISVRVFSALLLMAAFPGCLMFLFAKFPVLANSPDVELAQRTMWITRMFGAAMCAFLAALAAWWLYYFNLGSVKRQFASRHDASSGLDLESATRTGPYSGGRPLSITIIAGFLMMGALSLTPSFSFSDDVPGFFLYRSGGGPHYLDLRCCSSGAGIRFVGVEAVGTQPVDLLFQFCNF